MLQPSKMVIAITNPDLTHLRLTHATSRNYCAVDGWVVEAQIRSKGNRNALCTRFTNPDGRVLEIVLPGSPQDTAAGALGARLSPYIAALLRRTLTPKLVERGLATLGAVFTTAWNLDTAVVGLPALIVIEEAALGVPAGTVSQFLADVTLLRTDHNEFSSAFGVRTVAAMLDAGWSPALAASLYSIIGCGYCQYVSPAWVRAVHATGIPVCRFVAWADSTLKLFSRPVKDITAIGAYYHGGWDAIDVLAISDDDEPRSPSFTVIKGWAAFTPSAAMQLQEAGITPREATQFTRRGTLTEENIKFLIAMRGAQD